MGKRKTNKDIVFLMSVIFWLTSNIICLSVWGEMEMILSNMSCILIFGSMVLIKEKVRAFNDWLNKPFK